MELLHLACHRIARYQDTLVFRLLLLIVGIATIYNSMNLFAAAAFSFVGVASGLFAFPTLALGFFLTLCALQKRS